jgi:hypothetical protein
MRCATTRRRELSAICGKRGLAAGHPATKLQCWLATSGAGSPPWPPPASAALQFQSHTAPTEPAPWGWIGGTSMAGGDAGCTSCVPCDRMEIYLLQRIVLSWRCTPHTRVQLLDCAAHGRPCKRARSHLAAALLILQLQLVQLSSQRQVLLVLPLLHLLPLTWGKAAGTVTIAGRRSCRHELTCGTGKGQGTSHT